MTRRQPLVSLLVVLLAACGLINVCCRSAASWAGAGVADPRDKGRAHLNLDVTKFQVGDGATTVTVRALLSGAAYDLKTGRIDETAWRCLELHWEIRSKDFRGYEQRIPLKPVGVAPGQPCGATYVTRMFEQPIDLPNGSGECVVGLRIRDNKGKEIAEGHVIVQTAAN